MANASIGGLVSGLDTATIISRLMQLEARPQSLLKTRVSTEQRAVSALQSLNSKLAAIQTKAADLGKETSWSRTKAVSSNDKVLISADAGASPASLSFTVDAIATAAGAVYATTGATTASVMPAGVEYTITYDDGRATETINTGNGSLQAVANAVNGSDGLNASLVKAGDGSYELHVTSAATGSSSGFTITPVDAGQPAFVGGAARSTAGTDAGITLDGETVGRTFRSNTITDLMPGIDVTLLAGAAGPTTITVDRDVTSLSDSVKAMVDSVNTALGEIGTLTAYDTTTKTGGLLSGDGTVRGVRNELLGLVSGGVDGRSLATVGIQVDRSGKLTFDEAKFKAAYAADAVGTATLIGGSDNPDGTEATAGFADKLSALTKSFSDSFDGTVTTAVKSRQASITGWENDIADWDTRLAARQTALQRQYTALETALSKLQSQSSWLAGQVASLPQMSSGQ